VLKNYTSYKLAFKLANNGRNGRKGSGAQRGHEGHHALGAAASVQHLQKVQVVVEHFRENVAPLLNGKAKAMVVVGSRLEAVRWQMAIDKYIKTGVTSSARWWPSRVK
jgi:type I restriction enzyme R subunit